MTFAETTNQMSPTLLFSNLLLLLAFVVHTFVGDNELKINEPNDSKVVNDDHRREKWTMARCGWHWVSFDLLMATIILGLINFTNYFEDARVVLKVLSLYFFGYAIAWLCTIVVSKKFPNNYWKLGQWILLLVISGLIGVGAF